MRLIEAAAALLALLLLAPAPPFSAAQDCASFFNLEFEDFGTFQVYQHPQPTSELEASGSNLQTLQWTEDVFSDPTLVPEGSDTTYLEGVVSNSSMQINTIHSLEGLPDYGSGWNSIPKTSIALIYTFPFLEGGQNCRLQFVFPLEDLNTAAPSTDSTEYSTSLREDFPLSLTIPYLQVIATDLDGTPPNNLLKATFDIDCPLTTVDPQYDGTGHDVTINFMLTQKLDYDVMQDPIVICQVTVTDGGTDPEPLSTSLTITITVEGFEDEPPVFENSFYTSTLDSQQASAEPLPILPSAIRATDADKDGSPIVYSMTASEVDGPEWNDYFSIDESTAAVTLVKDIPDTMLVTFSTHFIVTATDGNSNSDTSTLEIVLPTATTRNEYMFELAAYNFEVYPTSRVAGTLVVVRTDDHSVSAENVSYQWDKSVSNGTDYFELDATTGQVLLLMQPALGYYVLKATAVVDGDSLNPISADVYIRVLKPSSCDDIFIAQGLIYTSVTEDTPVETPIVTINTQDGNEDSFCIVGVRPKDYEENFSIDKSGELTLNKTLDAYEMQEGERAIAVWIKALGKNEECPTVIGDSTRSEVIVVIKIEDVNDEIPTIVSPSTNIQVGYPSDRGLQEVVGPVISIEVEDLDTETDLEYTLSGEDSDLFLIEKTTGNLYLTEPSSCSGTCQVTVSVSDGLHDGEPRSITVVPLNSEKIYDIALAGKTTSQVQDEIEKLSNSTGFDLRLLYSSISLPDEGSEGYRVVGRFQPPHGRRLKRQSSGLRDSSWVSVAHIYGFDDQGNYISLEDLNSALPDNEKASTFSEKDTFSPAPEAADVTGYQVAVGILGGLLALIIVAAIVGFVYYRKKKRQAPNGPGQLNTLGAAYPNHAFSTEMSEIDRDNKSSASSGSDNRRVSVLPPDNAVDSSFKSTAPVQNDYENIEKAPFDSADTTRPTTSEFPYQSSPDAVAPGLERQASQHSLGGLHRIDPGPSPDGTKSSPYLTGSEGDFQVSRPTQDETVASFTAYKGEKMAEDSSKPLKVNASYAPSYKKEPYVSFGSTSEIVDGESRSRAESGASSKKSSNGYGVAVRAKKEPPDVSAASPAKPIMKKKSVTAEVHHEPEAPVAAGSFSKLQSSPTVKKKKKTKTSISSDDDTSKTKDGPSESGVSDSETKKSVAFKVLVDQKEIERINHDDESGTENF